MKKLILSFCFIAIIYPQLSAQSYASKANQAHAYEVLDRRYADSSAGFLEQIYAHVRYPLHMLDKCQMGVVTLGIDIEEASLQIKVLNASYPALKTEVERIMNSIHPSWLPGEGRDRFILTFGFEIGYRSEIESAVKIIAFPASGENPCPSRAELEEKLDRQIKKNSKRKAKKILQELLKRHPEDKEYQSLLKELDQS